MDLKRLPFLPPHFFYYQLTLTQKRMFLGLMALIVFAAGLWLFVYERPDHWGLSVSSVPETYAEVLAVDTVSHAYRDFPLTFRVYRQQVGYSASQLRPEALPFQLAFGLLLIGWTVILAVSSSISSRWAFLFYLLFGLFLHSTGVASVLLPDPWWGRLLEFGLILLFLGLAYLFQSRILRVNLPGRLLVIGGSMAFLFGLAYQTQGWLTLQQMGGESFVFLTMVSFFFLLLIGKEPTNLLIYAATNQPNPRHRLAPRWILAIYGLWLVVMLCWVDEFLGLKLTGIQLSFRPAHLLALSSILTVFLSQNLFHQLRSVVSSVGNFTLLLSAWALISLSTWFLFAASFDPVWVYAIERLAVILFAAVGLGHMFFTFTNHRFLLANKVNGFYLMGNGPRFPYAAIWLIGLIFLILAEGVESWKSLRLLPQSYAVQLADGYLLRDQREDARLHYEIALRATEASPKANYNLASLLLIDPDQLREAVRHYRLAGAGFDFPYGNLNAANLLLASQAGEAAEEVLREGVARFPDNALLWNGLGNFFLKSQQPDSAIAAYQKALLAELDLGPVYSNLAQLYWQYQRPEDARAFFRAALETPDPGAATLISASWYQLAAGDSLALPDPERYGYRDPLLSYNYQLLHIDQSPSPADRAQLKRLADEAQAPDALLLDAYQMLRDDSVAYALSRMQFLANQYPGYAAIGNYVVGIHFYERDLPELAQVYFERAGEAGDPRGWLYAAKMDIDLGRLAAGNDSLSVLRARSEALYEECSREIALLLSAVGQPLYAQTEWDLSTLTIDERVRLGRYADSAEYFSIALRTYQDLVAEEGAEVVPYLELGRIYNRYCDSLALVNLALGLEKASGDPRLRLAYARAWLCADQPGRGLAQLDSATFGADLAPDSARLWARIRLAQGDTAAAIAQLDTLVQADPYDRRSILLLAEVYLAQQKTFEGYTLLTNSLAINDRHPRLWYYYAAFAHLAGDVDAAANAEAQALALAFGPEQRAAMRADFASWSAVDAASPGF